MATKKPISPRYAEFRDARRPLHVFKLWRHMQSHPIWMCGSVSLKFQLVQDRKRQRSRQTRFPRHGDLPTTE